MADDEIMTDDTVDRIMKNQDALEYALGHVYKASDALLGGRFAIGMTHYAIAMPILDSFLDEDALVGIHRGLQALVMGVGDAQKTIIP
jgi:hypothetical protein